MFELLCWFTSGQSEVVALLATASSSGGERGAVSATGLAVSG
jgi:hypothetical protein